MTGMWLGVVNKDLHRKNDSWATWKPSMIIAWMDERRADDVLYQGFQHLLPQYPHRQTDEVQTKQKSSELDWNCIIAGLEVHKVQLETSHCLCISQLDTGAICLTSSLATWKTGKKCTLSTCKLYKTEKIEWYTIWLQCLSENMDNLENSDKKNGINFNNEKCQAQYLGRNNPMAQDRLAQKRSSSREEDLSIPVDYKLTMSQ